MSGKALAIIGAISLGIGFSAVVWYRNQEIDDLVLMESMAELNANGLAAEIVRQKIREGEYDPNDLDEIFSDLRFYKMIVRFED